MSNHRLPAALIPDSENPPTHRQLSARIGKPVQPPGLTSKQISAMLHADVPKAVAATEPNRVPAWADRYTVPPAPPAVVNVPHRATDLADFNSAAREYGVAAIPHHDDRGAPVYLVMDADGVVTCATVDEVERCMRRVVASRACGG
jgi:hypothetical protein